MLSVFWFNCFRLLSSPCQALLSLVSLDECELGGTEGPRSIMENVVHIVRLLKKKKKEKKTVQGTGTIFTNSMYNENRQSMRSARPKRKASFLLN